MWWINCLNVLRWKIQREAISLCYIKGMGFLLRAPSLWSRRWLLGSGTTEAGAVTSNKHTDAPTPSPRRVSALHSGWWQQNAFETWRICSSRGEAATAFYGGTSDNPAAVKFLCTVLGALQPYGGWATSLLPHPPPPPPVAPEVISFQGADWNVRTDWYIRNTFNNVLFKNISLLFTDILANYYLRI